MTKSFKLTYIKLTKYTSQQTAIEFWNMYLNARHEKGDYIYSMAELNNIVVGSAVEIIGSLSSKFSLNDKYFYIDSVTGFYKSFSDPFKDGSPVRFEELCRWLIANDIELD